MLDASSAGHARAQPLRARLASGRRAGSRPTQLSDDASGRSIKSTPAPAKRGEDRAHQSWPGSFSALASTSRCGGPDRCECARSQDIGAPPGGGRERRHAAAVAVLIGTRDEAFWFWRGRLRRLRRGELQLIPVRVVSDDSSTDETADLATALAWKCSNYTHETGPRQPRWRRASTFRPVPGLPGRHDRRRGRRAERGLPGAPPAAFGDPNVAVVACIAHAAWRLERPRCSAGSCSGVSRAAVPSRPVHARVQDRAP